MGERRRAMLKELMATTAIGLLTLMVPLGAVSASNDARPFKGSGNVMLEYVEDAGCGEFGRAQMSSEGRATHLGRLEMTATHCASYAPAGGEATMVAANGDALFLGYSGTCDESGSCSIDAQVTGGTGRFEDASGDAAFTVQFGAPQADGSIVGVWVWTGSLGY
jgi:hypothetical protein